MSAFIPSVEQAAIINAPAQDDVLVVAGAGSGKTFTMTQRIIALINRGVAPERILASAFTRKADRRVARACIRSGIARRFSCSTGRSDSWRLNSQLRQGVPESQSTFTYDAFIPNHRAPIWCCWLVSIRILSHSARLERSSSPLKSSMSIWIRL